MVNSRLTRKVLQATLYDFTDCVERQLRGLAKISGPAREPLVKGIQQAMNGVGPGRKKSIFPTGKRRGKGLSGPQQCQHFRV